MRLTPLLWVAPLPVRSCGGHPLVGHPPVVPATRRGTGVPRLAAPCPLIGGTDSHVLLSDSIELFTWTVEMGSSRGYVLKTPFDTVEILWKNRCATGV